MSHPLAAFSTVILAVVLDPLIFLLLPAAGGDATAAGDEALEMIAEFEPATREELRLAAEISAFGLQVNATLRDAGRASLNEAAAQALRRTACQLQRSETSARRLLSSLQRARRVKPGKDVEARSNTRPKQGPGTGTAETAPAAPATPPAADPGPAATPAPAVPTLAAPALAVPALAVPAPAPRPCAEPTREEEMALQPYLSAIRETLMPARASNRANALPAVSRQAMTAASASVAATA
ncbi:hypothetical protein [Rhodopila sp.]|jgi:hypothetical protein|uniref:hypothetical protein n=1 Tax=Rhodopila sp. TaxID=2480087 RepID=UPI002CABF0A0|nr:hypothetical protein [Rhodopila sp.]HVZ08326.1 hypothetical protein [Rhodopila sp.]